ncbi:MULTISPECIES: TonB-dependent receptor [unclassified Novosphingobium]|uniref:TonB-dependent receptor n=1 Tax=unclassified Novosphingobium TaxID=2644732 RepID=UPI0014477319|nr:MULTISPECIES: TonB-dependent receptor [unclassified Novosphingobium]NKJ45063.1 iron complex outermembrane receptor protein [Novosphingobium sp. SG720]NMN07634.1 iron complex outermembrane receptor protein [Novosphingobium sp. SG919]NMN89944.1 iron complex outermembrane receptor protein [Novosphingobium sp. SG916]
MRKHTLLMCSILGGFCSWAGQAHAQEEAPRKEAEVGEIVVTAQHRTENIQKVPIAISAFSGESLQQRGLGKISQVAAFTPNVEIKTSAAFAGSSQILAASIRGIGQNDFSFNLEPGVGVYIDGVYFARSLGAVVDLLDLQQMEVLKGPQGTLFGRNTIGGALNITTRAPDKNFRYAFDATVGSFSRTDVRGSVDLPLVEDKLLSQVSFSVKKRDGYQRQIAFPGAAGTVNDLGSYVTAGNQSGGTTRGDENQVNLRGKLKWIVNPDLNVLLEGDYTHVDQGARPITLIKTFAGGSDGTLFSAYNGCVAGAAPAFLCSKRGTVGTSFYGATNRLFISDAFVTGNIDTTYARGSNYDKLKTWGGSATVDWTLSSNAAIKSISAYRELHSSFGSENAGTPFGAGDASFTMNQAQTSQEIQLISSAFDNRLKSVAGLYYFNETGNLTDMPVLGEGLVQIYGRNYFLNDAYAAFAHEHFDVTDRLGVTFGLRYTKEDKRFEGQQKDLNSFFLRSRGYDPNLPLPPSAKALLPDPNDPTRIFPLGVNRQSFSNASIKAGLEYKLAPAIMTYYSYSQGFKSGGWTARLTDVISPPNDISQLTFKPEKAQTHEIGLKSTLFGRKLRLNIAAFNTDYTDIQVTQFVGISPVIKNAGKALIRGAEAEAQGQFGEFSINASLGYMDAHYTYLAPGVTYSVQSALVNTPKWSATLGGLWHHDLGDGKAISTNLDYTYKSNSHPDAENSPYLQSGNVGLLNGSISYTAKDDRIGLTFGVQNMTDKRYVTGGFDQSGVGQIGFVSATYSPPRQWYLTLRVKG